jgi:hypothetical protein
VSYIPFNSDRPAIEKLIGDRLKEKVTIGAVHVSVLPLPKLSLSDVVIGDGEDVKIDTVTVPWDAFGGDKEKKAYKQVELDTVTIKQSAIARLQDWGSLADPASKLSIETLTMHTIRLTLNDVLLDKFDGQVALAPDGTFLRANFFLPDQDRLKAEVVNRDGALAVSFSAKKWRAPLADALVFGELRFKGVAHPGSFDATEIEAQVGDGAAKGNGRLEWGERWKLTANLEFNGVDMDGITQRFTQQLALTGRLDTRLALSTQGTALANLFAAPHVEGEFALANGALGNVDLMKAIIEAPNYDKVRGGQTFFKKFSGVVLLADQRLALRQLSMVSGSLAAGGAVDVMPDSSLNGKVNLELGSTEGNPVKDTVLITGSLKEPIMKPSK